MLLVGADGVGRVLPGSTAYIESIELLMHNVCSMYIELLAIIELMELPSTFWLHDDHPSAMNL